MWQFVLRVAAIATLVFAETFNIDVGKTGLTFNPNILHNVAPGDVVNFHFYPANHSVAESTFNKPCKPKSGGVDVKPIYSGFVSVNDGVAKQMWSMSINTTDPIWLYCSQGNHQHCRNGQSMVINPLNDTDQTLDNYMEAAKSANVSSPNDIFGGQLIDDDGGQPDGGPRALPTTSLSASSTNGKTSATGGSTTRASSGVAPIMRDVLRELSVWGILAAVFFGTL